MGHGLRGEQPERPPGAAQYSDAVKAKDEEIGVKKEWIEAAEARCGADLAKGIYAPFVRAFLEAAAKNGWKLVPREATEEMILAVGCSPATPEHHRATSIFEPGNSQARQKAVETWEAMRAAAPATPPGSPDD
jgi:aryl-alcohol dehydrogenase-like predicted oxidoreductase